MNESVYIQTSSGDVFCTFDGGEAVDAFTLGNATATKHASGACRFQGVNIGRSVSVASAQLKIYAGYTTGGTLRFKCTGIKENNTGAFTSNPFGRSRTTATVTASSGIPGVGGYLNIDVRDIVNEILGQVGWNSGNSLGLLVENNGSDDPAYLEDDYQRANLVIRLAAEPDLRPTPVTIAAPTFPGVTDYGIRVSMPGVDVKTATEDQLFFTSRKKQLRVRQELVLTHEGTIAHGLGYAPFALGYYEEMDNTVRIMNYPSNRFSVEPWVATDETNIVAGVVPGKNAYIYIFIDPLT